MKKRNTAVTKSLVRPEAYGLLFRHEYEVLPGYGETGDIIRPAKWAKPAKPKRAAARKAKADKPARRKA
jgi:hypothetical protein